MLHSTSLPSCTSRRWITLLSEDHVTWLEEKGIDPTFAETEFGLHSDAEMLVFPYPNSGEKKRSWNADGSRRFTFTPGKRPWLYHRVSGIGTSECCFLCEGESDTIRLSQVRDETVYGISGVNGWHSAMAQEIKAEKVYVILDNDSDYNVRAKVDAAWLQIRKDLGRRAVRVHLPSDVNDVCEFLAAYPVEALDGLLEDAGKGKLHYQALDLTKEPPPYDWLVDGLICKGDVCLMIGPPNVGKSWFAMSLAVGVAEGWKDWLGLKLRAPGKVLVIDEENPVDVVYHRLRKLGLSHDGSSNIRYLHRQGIRMDRHPDWILEEALNWNPDLIVMDSLTRIHTKDENNAGEVASLFNDGINPLARETGATVLLLHHTNKTDTTNSYTKLRGSSDIGASVDTGLEVIKADSHGGLSLAHFKSRRSAHRSSVHVRLEDVDDMVVLRREKESVF